MKVRFWGVRGSVPSPGPTTVRYGGNTSCVQLTTDDGRLIILDAGTGLRALGDFMMREKMKCDSSILLSHTHWDHTSGFPFFIPAYIPGNSITFRGPVHYEQSLREVMVGQTQYAYFPVRVEDMAAKVDYVDQKEGEFELCGMKVTARYLNHPVLCLGYRFESPAGKVFVYGTDTEPFYNVFGESDPLGDEDADDIAADLNGRIVDFVRNADVVVWDGQYTPAEYDKKKGWGHTSTEQGMDMAIKAGVKHFIFFHHDPNRTDDQLDQIVKDSQAWARQRTPNLQVSAATEGVELVL